MLENEVRFVVFLQQHCLKKSNIQRWFVVTPPDWKNKTWSWRTKKSPFIEVDWCDFVITPESMNLWFSRYNISYQKGVLSYQKVKGIFDNLHIYISKSKFVEKSKSTLVAGCHVCQDATRCQQLVRESNSASTNPNLPSPINKSLKKALNYGLKLWCKNPFISHYFVGVIEGPWLMTQKDDQSSFNWDTTGLGVDFCFYFFKGFPRWSQRLNGMVRPLKYTQSRLLAKRTLKPSGLSSC